MSKIDQIRFRRNDNGLYFDAFETKEKAFEYLQKLNRKYHHSAKGKYTIKDLCAHARSEDVVIYPKFLGKVFKEVFNTTIHQPANNVSNRKTDTVRWDKAVLDRLAGLSDQYMKSWYLNAVMRAHMGLEFDGLFVFLDDPLRKHGVSIYICQPKNEWVGLKFGEISTETKRMIEEWTYDVTQQGLDYLERKLKINGHIVIRS